MSLKIIIIAVRAAISKVDVLPRFHIISLCLLCQNWCALPSSLKSKLAHIAKFTLFNIFFIYRPTQKVTIHPEMSNIDQNQQVSIRITQLNQCDCKFSYPFASVDILREWSLIIDGWGNSQQRRLTAYCRPDCSSPVRILSCK